MLCNLQVLSSSAMILVSVMLLVKDAASYICYFLSMLPSNSEVSNQCYLESMLLTGLIAMLPRIMLLSIACKQKNICCLLSQPLESSHVRQC